ncbi:hypothetical protein [Pseudonocardia sp. TRM90224]|uniref:hypothetical protein n=1 Tax=Pseudonocardia sp. TRM90224 TaxID=2812678 RepID=UPI001E2D0F42|nr:hypothetical protein [Pseudonocardia sp. TRM90224]
MRPDVSRDPDRLRYDAALARRLADVLLTVARQRNRPTAPSRAHEDELDRLVTAVRRAAVELADLDARLLVAAGIDDVDGTIAAALREGRT